MEFKSTTRAQDAYDVLPRASMLDSDTQACHVPPPADGAQPLASVTHDPNSTDFTFIQEIVASVEASQARLPEAPNPGSPLASESQTGREQMTMFEFLAISVVSFMSFVAPVRHRLTRCRLRTFCWLVPTSRSLQTRAGFQS